MENYMKDNKESVDYLPTATTKCGIIHQPMLWSGQLEYTDIRVKYHKINALWFFWFFGINMD